MLIFMSQAFRLTLSQHIFNIASEAPIGALATQLGLIARYGNQYPIVNYIAKLNSKITLYLNEKSNKEPFSKQLWTVDDVVRLKEQSQLPIRGIGLTIYIGSEYGEITLAQASESIFQAHQHGLIAILWMYPRGKAVKDENDPALLAGATGVAVCLGADFAEMGAKSSAW